MLITDIGLLAGILPSNTPILRGREMDAVETIAGAWLRTSPDGTVIDSFGSMRDCPAPLPGEEVIDAENALVTPAFCDCHTHLVYAGSRQTEYRDKIAGRSYAEIAANGGGILNSARRLADTPESVLLNDARRRLEQLHRLGTAAIEIKSGYGLTLDAELKMLRVIRRLRDELPHMTIRSTFLGAHAVGPEFTGRPDEYVRHVIDDMIPAVAAEGLADYIDVFCEKGFFTPEQTAAILNAGAAHSMRPRLHADQLTRSGGTAVAVACNAISVDHLEAATDAEIGLIAESDTIPVGLPGASFFLSDPYAPARALIDAGCPLALASDYNPGTSPSGSMVFVWALGCIKMRLTPEQAFNAITINGAAALGIAQSHGSITPGKQAHLIIYEPWVPLDLAYIPYAYTEPTIHRVIG